MYADFFSATADGLAPLSGKKLNGCWANVGWTECSNSFNAIPYFQEQRKGWIDAEWKFKPILNWFNTLSTSLEHFFTLSTILNDLFKRLRHLAQQLPVERMFKQMLKPFKWALNKQALCHSGHPCNQIGSFSHKARKVTSAMCISVSTTRDPITKRIQNSLLVHRVVSCIQTFLNHHRKVSVRGHLWPNRARTQSMLNIF